MFIHKAFTFSIVLAACLPASPVAAQPQDIVVTAQPSVIIEWAARVGGDIGRHMAFPREALGQDVGGGVVRVQFRGSETGKPSDVMIKTSSGSRQLDAAGARAVRRIATLNPLPDGIAPDQKYEAVLLFAASEQDRDRQFAILKADAVRQNQRLAERRAGLASAPILIAVGR